MDVASVVVGAASVVLGTSVVVEATSVMLEAAVVSSVVVVVLTVVVGRVVPAIPVQPASNGQSQTFLIGLNSVLLGQG